LGIYHIFERIAHIVSLDVVDHVLDACRQRIQEGTFHMCSDEFGGQIVGNTVPKRIFTQEAVLDVCCIAWLSGAKMAGISDGTCPTMA
jgi:hypothetical protein